MKLFFVKRHADRGLEEIRVFDGSETLEASVAQELAELEGSEARVFVGADLVDVALGAPAWFEVVERALGFDRQSPNGQTEVAA